MANHNRRTSDFWVGLALFFLVFVCGLATVCPTIYWRDAPEFVDVVQTYGIPHPAGSPTYILLAKISTLIPLGNLALRVNMVSVFFQALTIMLLFVTSGLLMRTLFSHWEVSWIRFGALLASLNFAISPSFWLVSSFAEVYSMSATFFMSCILCAVLFQKTKDCRFLYLGAFIYGLSAGVHATAVFYLPAVIFFFFSMTPKRNLKTCLLWVSVFFLFGFSTYLYLPIRSLANPPFDWGNPETLHQFLTHITDRKTQSSHFDFKEPSLFLMNAVRYFDHLVNEMGWFGMVPAVAGLGFQLWSRRGKRILVYCLLLYLGNVTFFLNWKTGDGFIPSNLILSFWSALGFAWMISQCAKIRIRFLESVRWDRIFVLTVGLFLITKGFIPGVLSSLPGYMFADRAKFFNAYETARAEYDKIPMDAIAITTLYWFPFRYFQDVERHREDLSIVMASDIVGPRYFNPLNSQRFPKIKLPHGDPLKTPWFEYMPEFINLNISERQIYYEPNLTLVKPIFRNLFPDLFLFQVVSDDKNVKISEEILQPYREKLDFLIKTQTQAESFKIDFNSREYYMSFLLFSADYFLLLGREREAMRLLRVASELRPNQGTVEYYLGLTEIGLGEVTQGKKRLEKLLETNATFGPPNLILARLYLRMGDLEEANRYLSRTKNLKDLQKQRALLKVEYAWREGDLSQARELLESAKQMAQFADDKSEIEFWREIINDVETF